MKNIVLYGMVMMVGLLSGFTESAGQKPAYDLLPSTNHSIHPEAIVDTSMYSDADDSVFHGSYPLTSSSNTTIKDTQRKEKKKAGLLPDSLFKKPTPGDESQIKTSGYYPLIIKYINPINFFLHITAIKK